jgi:2-desacetyl-2-hydroxyethyl bacteriochlorophyllide A dehydrogenase
MKAAVMRTVKAPLVLEEVPVPPIAPHEVLVETRTSGICGTDLHILEGRGYVPNLPHILGHEPAGVVAEVGSDVTDLRPGDRVVPHLFFTCDRCSFCQVGRHQQCARLKGILGVLCNGAFADYFKAPAANLFRLPSEVPFDAGGLAADAVVTGLHALKRGNTPVGSAALVYGAGGVGQILIQLLYAGGVQVVALDRSAEKLRLAREMGATLALDAQDRRSEGAIRDISGADGVQCAFNCVGSSQSMKDCARYVARGGRIVVIGEEPEFPSIDTTEIAQRELEIIGSRNGTRQDLVEALHLLRTGVVKPYVAARFPLQEVNAAFECMRSQALGRVVIVVKE